MTETNSPGLILNDTSSTATIGPSAVSKRTTMLSTIRMASELPVPLRPSRYSLLRVITAVMAAV